MTESKKFVALTLDGGPSWFGYDKGAGHVVLSTVVNQGGDHIGGNPLMQPVCPGSKPLDAARQTNRVVEKFTGDAKCKRCEAWLITDAGKAAVESAQGAAYADENAAEIAELGAEVSAQLKIAELVSEGVWNVAPAVMEEGPAGVMVVAADTPWHEEGTVGVLALTPQERGDALSAKRRAVRAVMVRPDEPVTQSEPATVAASERKAQDTETFAQTLDAIMHPAPLDDPLAESAPVATSGLPGHAFPPPPGTRFGTGMLGNEAAIVRGKSQTGAPADRKTFRPGKGQPKRIADRGTMGDPTGRDHLDESVKAPDKLQSFVDSHPAVVAERGVTVRKYNAMTDTRKRRYRRMLCTQSANRYAAEQAVKDAKKAEKAAKRAALKGDK